jgi:hypothetical protein
VHGIPVTRPEARVTHGKALMVLPLALSIISLDVGCAPQHSAESESPRPVKTLLVTAGNKPATRSFPGKVEDFLRSGMKVHDLGDALGGSQL